MKIKRIAQSDSITRLKEAPNVEISYDETTKLYIITGKVNDLKKTSHTEYRGKYNNIPYACYRHSFKIGEESFSVSVGFNLESGDTLTVIVDDKERGLDPIVFHNHRNNIQRFLKHYSGVLLNSIVLMAMCFVVFLIVVYFPIIYWPLGLIIPFMFSRVMMDQYSGLNQQLKCKSLLLKNILLYGTKISAGFVTDKLSPESENEMPSFLLDEQKIHCPSKSNYPININDHLIVITQMRNGKEVCIKMANMTNKSERAIPSFWAKIMYKSFIGLSQLVQFLTIFSLFWFGLAISEFIAVPILGGCALLIFALFHYLLKIRNFARYKITKLEVEEALYSRLYFAKIDMIKKSTG